MLYHADMLAARVTLRCQRARCCLSALTAAGLLLGCGSNVAVGEAGGGAAAGLGGSSTGGMGGAGAAAGGISFGGNGGSGGTPFAHDCTDTSLGVGSGTGPEQLLTAACPEAWGQQFFPGPSGYLVNAGATFAGFLSIDACGPGGTPQMALSSTIAGPGTTPLGGSYDDGSTASTVASGTLTVDIDGDVGHLIEGSYAATFTSTDASLSLHGSFRVCHVPNRNLP